MKDGESKGVALAESLRSKDDLDKERTIHLVLKDHKSPEVIMTGMWDGNLLRAAMHAIEKQYDQVRRHATVNAMKVSQQSNSK